MSLAWSLRPQRATPLRRRCEPVTAVQAITEVETDAEDKPLEDIHMQTVEITRCAP